MTFFFFNDTATTEIYTLSLHDALPIFAYRPLRRTETNLRMRAVAERLGHRAPAAAESDSRALGAILVALDRKSTRLNSSHANISYAVFCLKKKKKLNHITSNMTSPDSD